MLLCYKVPKGLFEASVLGWKRVFEFGYLRNLEGVCILHRWADFVEQYRQFDWF